MSGGLFYWTLECLFMVKVASKVCFTLGVTRCISAVVYERTNYGY